MAERVDPLVLLGVELLVVLDEAQEAPAMQNQVLVQGRTWI